MRTIQHFFKEREISELTRLLYFILWFAKPSEIIKLQHFLHCGECRVVEHENTHDGCTCSTLAVVTMNHDHIFLIFLQLLVDEVHNLKESIQTRSLVICPGILLYSASEGFNIAGTATDVDDIVELLMFFCEEGRDISDAVPHCLFKTRGWKSHSYDPVGDVGEVEVVVTLNRAIFGPSHDSPKPIKHKSFIKDCLIQSNSF
jgi:hypothetical protein